MKIEKFNKVNLKEIRAKALAALSDVEKEYGVSAEIGNCSYQDHEVTFKLKISLLDESGTKKQDFKEFVLWASSYGLDVEDFGKTFIHRGLQVEIVGLNRRRWRYPIKAVGVDGISWFFSPKYILKVLGKSGD